MRRKKTGLKTALLFVATLVLASCASTPPGAPGAPSAGPPSAPSPSMPGTPSPGGTDAKAGAEKAEGSSGKGAGSNPGGAQTAEERGKALDDKLDESLREFDRLLMREQETLADRRVTPESGGSGGGGGGAGAAGAAGGGGGEADGRQGDSGASGTDVGETTGDSPSAPTGAQRAPGRQEDGEREARIPPDVGDGDGDDVVARQLREAAMNEDDPELREKLWQEYRDYKSGRKRRQDD